MTQIGNSLPTGFLGLATRLRRLVACDQRNLQVLWHWHQWRTRSMRDAIRSRIQLIGFAAASTSLKDSSLLRWIAGHRLAASEIALGFDLTRCDGARAVGLTSLQVTTRYPWERMI